MEIISNGNFRHTESIAKLTEAMAAAVQEFGEVIKDVTNPFFKSTYADLSSLIGATRAQLGKHGLVIFQGPGFNEVIGPSVTTLLSHVSAEWIAVDLPLPAAKLDPQGVGSALTYSRRYGYGPMLNVAAEEDDDGNAAVATRKEHLDQLTEKMTSQERISHVQATAFLKTAIDNGRTQEQIKQYLDQLNGYLQATEIQKQDWDKAKAWALNKPADTDLIGDLSASLQQARLKRLFAIANKKKISYTAPNDDLHRMVEETYQKKSLKELTEKQFNDFVEYLESLNPAG